MLQDSLRKSWRPTRNPLSASWIDYYNRCVGFPVKTYDPQFRVRWATSFAISSGALTLQFVQTRLLSFIYWQHIVYSILTISMLGIAASGTVLYAFRRLGKWQDREFITLCLTGFAISSVISVHGVTLLNGDFFTPAPNSISALNIVRLLGSYLVLAVPYLFFGLLILGLLQRQPSDAGRLYSANLIGSAGGILLFLFLIQKMGALNLLRFGVFAPAALMSLALLNGVKRRAGIQCLVLFLVFGSSYFISLSPDKNKQFHILFPGKTLEMTEWNPISRIDVISAPLSGKAILIDGDAMARLMPGTKRVLDEAKFVCDDSLPAIPCPLLSALEIPTPEWGPLSILLKFKPEPRGGPQLISLRVKNLTGDIAGVEVKFPLDSQSSGQVYLGFDFAEGIVSGLVNGKRLVKELPPNLRLGPSVRLALVGQEGASSLVEKLVSKISVWDRVLSIDEAAAAFSMTDGPVRHIAYVARGLAGNPHVANTLIIGNGGAADTVISNRYAPQHIDAVEVNPTSYRLVREEYSSYLGGLFYEPHIRLHLEDGRSFVRRSPIQYDVMSMVAVDSLAASSFGAYVLAENYLYTVEALSDYWDHLSDTGMMQISRWHFPSAPREALRVFTMTHEMMKRKGVTDPERHLMVFTQKNLANADGGFATLLFSKAPFTLDTTLKLGNWAASEGLEFLYGPSVEIPGEPNAYYRFVTAAKAGELSRFYDEYPYRVSPVFDDNPFPFQYARWSHLWKDEHRGPRGFESIMGKWPLFILLSLVVMVLLALAGLLIPIFKSATKSGSSLFPVCAYFSCLGMAFMFVEVALIQRFVLLLEHPVYSMAVTIPMLLLSAGLGSRYAEKGWSTWNFVLLVGMLLALSIFGEKLSGMGLSLPLWLRMVGVGLVIFPLGFSMGIPFPSGVKSIEARHFPLAWGLNAGMSVLASVAGIILAMEWGFKSLFLCASGLYLASYLTRFLVREKRTVSVRGSLLPHPA